MQKSEDGWRWCSRGELLWRERSKIDERKRLEIERRNKGKLEIKKQYFWQVNNEHCKVEFYQPSCWLYFVQNLLVFQQLVTLYLGGILVRVVSEIVWRNAQECARKIGTRDWISWVTSGYKPPEAAHVPGILEVKVSRQLEHYRTK